MALARRRRHLSQSLLAERMGASVSTVRRMEKGDAPGADTLFRPRFACVRRDRGPGEYFAHGV
ncbi:helix-turn-helix transcriptional regulator [Acerihabitans sp. KWT182]|uniref:Helix-turn-helix transcriptional regulator n=1 Tax=Acerihabitans sp. KWT182 TaxID=3157919 RepID=A0AAU7QGW6_9GAMM